MKRDIVAVDYIDREGEKHRVITGIPEELAHKYNFIQWAERTVKRLQDKGNEVVGTFVYDDTMNLGFHENWRPIKRYISK